MEVTTLYLQAGIDWSKTFKELLECQGNFFNLCYGNMNVFFKEFKQYILYVIFHDLKKGFPFLLKSSLKSVW